MRAQERDPTQSDRVGEIVLGRAREQGLDPGDGAHGGAEAAPGRREGPSDVRGGGIRAKAREGEGDAASASAAEGNDPGSADAAADAAAASSRVRSSSGSLFSSPAAAATTIAAEARPHVPEPQGAVRAAPDQRLTVGKQGQGAK